MARKPLTPRQQQLQEAFATLKAEKAALKHQQARVAAARQTLDQLSRCDLCGATVLPYGAELQLCRGCAADQNEQRRVKFLAQHGYGPDGKRLIAA